jgi:hypothetical protein
LVHERDRADDERRLGLALDPVGRVGEEKRDCTPAAASALVRTRRQKVNERTELDSLAESHVVGEDAAALLARFAVLEPVQALDLVREEGALEAGRRSLRDLPL